MLRDGSAFRGGAVMLGRSVWRMQTPLEALASPRVPGGSARGRYQWLVLPISTLYCLRLKPTVSGAPS